MARTYSSMMPLGTTAPDFSLPNTRDDAIIRLADARGEKGTLVMFICNHCPFVLHIADHFAKLNDYIEQGIGVVAISSNDVNHYPDDAPDKMQGFAAAYDFEFPYLFDESQDTARAYGAECTPDFFLFDERLACVYRGRFDASSPGNAEPITGSELFGAMDALLKGISIEPRQHPSIGCNIKWRMETA